MSQELREALLDLRNQRMDEALLHGTTAVSQLVFCGSNEQPSNPSWLYRMHRRVCEQAGLRVIRVHDLHHNYATIQLYEHHTPIQYESEQLGHSSIKITVDTYGHPRQGLSINLADQLDSAKGNAKQCATYTQPNPINPE
jgi:integrase